MFYAAWLGSLACLLSSWYWPLVSVQKFFVFTNEVSIISALLTLMEESYFFILIAVFLVSVLLPLGKLYLLIHCYTYSKPGSLKWLEHFGKWSFTDVFIVAFMVVILKIDGMVSVQVQLGFYLFVASATISYALTHWLKLRYQHLEQ